MIKRSIKTKSLKAPARSSVSARFSEDFMTELNETIKRQGYGPKQRSKWVTEAVQALFASWRESKPEDLVLDLLAYKPQVSNTDPTPFLLSAEAAANFNELLNRVSGSKRPPQDAKTRVLYAAIARRIIRDNA